MPSCRRFRSRMFTSLSLVRTLVSSLSIAQRASVRAQQVFMCNASVCKQTKTLRISSRIMLFVECFSFRFSTPHTTLTEHQHSPSAGIATATAAAVVVEYISNHTFALHIVFSSRLAPNREYKTELKRLFGTVAFGRQPRSLRFISGGLICTAHSVLSWVQLFRYAFAKPFRIRRVT